MSTAGYVYLLINYSMPGLVKVGMTIRPPTARMQELSGATGVPTPFDLVYDILVPDALAGEQWIHRELTARGYREAANREFFRAPIHEVVKLMLQVRELMEAATVADRPTSDLQRLSDLEAAGTVQDEVLEEWDDLFGEAAKLCVQQEQGSTALLQKRLRLGYGRAARIIDQLEHAGVLSAPDGSKPRAVLVDQQQLQRMLDQGTPIEERL